MAIGAVVLAAGLSSRLGQLKPLAPLGEKSLLGHCATLFAAVGIKRVLVVTGHQGAAVQAEAERLGLDWLDNPHYEQGMFSSVQAALAGCGKLEGFFLLPVDIPLVRPATLRTMLRAFSGKGVIVPSFQGTVGHPPLISRELISAIRDHDGSGGLAGLLAKWPTRTIPVWDHGIGLDADTPADLAILVDRLAAMTRGERCEAQALAELTMSAKGVEHGRAVAKVALALGLEVNRLGRDLDLDLLHNAALLHDLAKGVAQHEARGAALLTELGLSALAESVAGHRDVLPPVDGLLREKELVCLADKLVRGVKRLPVAHRFAEKMALYQNDPAACRAIGLRMSRALALQRLLERETGRGIEAILASGGQ